MLSRDSSSELFKLRNKFCTRWKKKVKDQTSQQLISSPLSTLDEPPAMLVHRIRPIRSTLIARHSTLRGWLSDQPRNDASQIHLRREQREIASMR